MLCVVASSQDLDRPVDAKRTFKMEFLFEGWHNQFAGKDMISLMNIIKGTFGANSELTGAMNYFMQQWPSSTEIIALGGVRYANWNNANAYVRTDEHGDHWYDATRISSAQNYFLDEYGQMVSSTDTNVMSRWNANYNVVSETSTAYVASGRVSGTPSASVYGGTSDDGDRARHYIDAINIYIDGKKYTIQDQVTCSPIVLDLDGDGQLQASSGQWLPHKYLGGKLVKFDMDGDGFVDMSEWVGPNDGLLIAYKGQETVTGHNLFGDADGFLNGYFKLQLLDVDKNGKLNGEELKTLSVWQDKNSNAKIDAGEVKTVKELGITELNLNHKNLVSNFVQNGETKTMWDWYPSTFAIKATE
jgi:hypothetical protein